MHRRRSTSALAPLVALTAALTPATAPAADRFEATRSAALVERSHAVDLVMDADRATLTVRRTVHNGGPRHDQATFWIEVPEGGVATGLRTQATVKGRPVWYAGDLMEAEAAAAKYHELTGLGGYTPMDPALLSWRRQRELALQVFPCPPGEDKSVEYTLTLPVDYVRGRSVLKLPRLGTEGLAADVRVRPASRRDQVFLGDTPVPPGTRVDWPTAVVEDEDADALPEEIDEDAVRVPYDLRVDVGGDEVLVSLARREPARLSGRIASVALPSDRHLREVEVEAAPKLSQAPRGAHVVVLIDTSRSLSDRDVSEEIAAAQATLAGFPDARVEVIPFARRPERLFGRFIRGDAAILALEGLQPARHNGSDVDVALASAVEALQAAPRGAPRRVLLLTDALTRESLTPARLRGALATTGALVHVGLPTFAVSPKLLRDDAHAWSPAVKSTGGLVWAAASGYQGAGQRRAVFEEWVRPLRIDHLKVVLPGRDAADIDAPESLAEGQGLRDLRLHAAALPWVRVEGELWTKPLREVFTRDRAHGRLWSALVLGSELLHQLTDEEMMTLALHGRAVSPVTSYLAVEPGVRPSTEGLLEGEPIGLGSIGLIGRGGGGGTGARNRVRPYNHRAWLRAQLANVKDSCGAPALQLTLETTRDEIVAVAAQLSGASDPVSTRCVEEGVWAWRLHAMFTAAWERYVVSV